MRIAIFTNNYLPIVSGVTRSIEEYQRKLENQGHKVYIFAPKYSGYLDKEQSVFRYPAVNVKYKVSYPLAIRQAGTKKAERKLREFCPEIIHSQHPTVLGSEALKFSKKLRIPIIFTYHTLYEEYVHYIPLIPGWALRRAVSAQALRYCNKCDGVIAPTGEIKKMLMGKGASVPIEVIPSGIEIEKFRIGDRKKIRNLYNIQDHEILLLCVSRLAKEKNLGLLLKAFRKLSLKIDTVKLMLVGGGHAADSLKKIAAELGVSRKTIFPGLIDLDEIQDYYLAGDIFAYSSMTETQGMIVAEAMAAGLPVVAVDATGSRDVVIDGKTGYLTENSVSDFSKKIEDLIEDGELRKKFSKAALAESEKYDVGVSTKNLLEFYEKTIRNSFKNIVKK
ncbi:MAG: glycosyltransferase [Parcubacteria group bacterium]|jgi:glycosyltransferase involved in cell wall biosynthesis